MKKELALTLIPLVALLIGSSSGYVPRTCPPDNFDRVEISPEDTSRTSSFGFDLFKKIRDQVPGENLFFSSYSIWSALAIAYFGAEGRTLAQLQKVLRLKEKDKGYKTQRLLSAQLKKNVGIELDEVNRAYFADFLVLEKCFRSGDFYDIHQVDFSNPERLAKEINGFVNRTTRGFIPELVKPNDLQGSRYFLANAIYFKGSWQKPFPEHNTYLRKFFCSPGVACRKVQTMQNDDLFNYGNDTHLGAEVLELPYLNSSISMLLFLPWEGAVTVDDVVDRLDLAALGGTLKGLEKQRILVYLPKFKMEQTLGHELGKALVDLGITDLLSVNSNLSAFTKSVKLKVDTIIHKAVVEVTERGTQAAAATGFTDRNLPPVFACNRPFIFMIVDKTLGLTLFSGIYRTPPV
ncbi:serine protease inhibitor 88Ea-like isoform X2 [Oratosquilla oratoria]